MQELHGEESAEERKKKSGGSENEIEDVTLRIRMHEHKGITQVRN